MDGSGSVSVRGRGRRARAPRSPRRVAPFSSLALPSLALLSLASAALASAHTLLLPREVLAEPFSVTDDRGVRVDFDAPPQRIVSLLPSLSETVCALGACDRLVGTDRFSNWPESVVALPKLGGFEDVQVERLYALRPDLVLAAESTRVIERLESLGLDVVALEPRSLAGARRTLGTLAELLDLAGAGRELLARVDERVRSAAGRVPSGWHGAEVYFEVSSTPHAAGESSFIGELLAELGLGNVVPASLGPFPALNPEYVVRADPDVIMGTRSGVDGMAERPGWGSLSALEKGHVCGFEQRHHDVLVRPGPRLGEAAEILADCLATLPPRASVPR